jgi:hypothetical protein
MNPSDILQTITLAVAGWTLVKVISQGEAIAAIRQQLKDLPCDKCE